MLLDKYRIVERGDSFQIRQRGILFYSDYGTGDLGGSYWYPTRFKTKEAAEEWVKRELKKNEKYAMGRAMKIVFIILGLALLGNFIVTALQLGIVGALKIAGAFVVPCILFAFIFDRMLP